MRGGDARGARARARPRRGRAGGGHRAAAGGADRRARARGRLGARPAAGPRGGLARAAGRAGRRLRDRGAAAAPGGRLARAAAPRGADRRRGGRRDRRSPARAVVAPLPARAERGPARRGAALAAALGREDRRGDGDAGPRGGRLRAGPAPGPRRAGRRSGRGGRRHRLRAAARRGDRRDGAGARLVRDRVDRGRARARGRGDRRGPARARRRGLGAARAVRAGGRAARRVARRAPGGSPPAGLLGERDGDGARARIGSAICSIRWAGSATSARGDSARSARSPSSRIPRGIFRAARYAARLGLRPDPQTRAAIAARGHPAVVRGALRPAPLARDRAGGGRAARPPGLRASREMAGRNAAGRKQCLDWPSRRRRRLARWARAAGVAVDPAELFMLALLAGSSATAVARCLDRLRLSGEPRANLEAGAMAGPLARRLAAPRLRPSAVDDVLRPVPPAAALSAWLRGSAPARRRIEWYLATGAGGAAAALRGRPPRAGDAARPAGGPGARPAEAVPAGRRGGLGGRGAGTRERMAHIGKGGVR